MSLNYQYDKVPEHLHTNKWVYEGKEQSCMGVKLQSLIWLTMTLRLNYCGGAKAKTEVKKRFNFLKQNGLIEPVYPSKEMIESQPSYWAGAKKSHLNFWEYELTEADIDSHWGLWTNSHYPDESFSKWKGKIESVKNPK